MDNGRRNLLVVVVHKTIYNRDGAWTNESYNTEMWTECLSAWDSVTVAGPGIEGPTPKGWTRADGPNIGFAPLTFSAGYWGSLAAIPRRLMELRTLVAVHDAVVLHTPSDIGVLATLWARVYRRPYALDVRGDQSVNWRYLKARGTPFPYITALLFSLLFMWVRSGAGVAIYVSNELRNRFPIHSGTTMLVYSDVRLKDCWFVPPRDYSSILPPRRLAFVGRLEAQKGLDVLLTACWTMVSAQHVDFTLDIIGDGPLRKSLQQLTDELAIGEIVSFRGYIERGEALCSILKESDLFVLPSITEGMPRSLLEAMASSLPVIATNVGGVPEVVDAEYLVPAGDSNALAAKLLEVLESPAKLTNMSRSSCKRASSFRLELLCAGKQQFYSKLRCFVER